MYRRGAPDNSGVARGGRLEGADRVVKAYYRNAADKRRALRDIIGMNDPHAFLAKSGWYPGIVLD